MLLSSTGRASRRSRTARTCHPQSSSYLVNGRRTHTMSRDCHRGFLKEFDLEPNARRGTFCGARSSGSGVAA
jgi:hypothetical protein